MNKTIKMSTLLMILAFGLGILSSCVKEKYETPEINVPSVNFSSNTTIAALLAMNTGTVDTITDDIIIQGIVVGNDESGNIYKSLYIQDQTGGIQIVINQTGLYNTYRLGQKILVKCKGLYLGTYGGMIELGYTYNGGIGQIPSILVADHLFLDSIPGPVPAATVLTIPAITAANYGTLVKFENVYFENPGVPFSTATAITDQNLMDANDNVIVVRTSNYANFRADLMPNGTGTVYGILSNFNGSNQLYIRDMNDVVGFTGTSPVTILSQPFNSSIGSFTSYSVTGAQVWTFNSQYGMTISGYSGGNNANEDWLISPALDLTNTSSIYLTFQNAINYATIMTTDQTVWISSDYVSGAPSTATWQQLTIPNYPAGNNWTYVNSGHVDFPALYEGLSNVHFAFKYLSSTSGAANWELNTVKVKGLQ